MCACAWLGWRRATTQGDARAWRRHSRVACRLCRLLLCKRSVHHGWHNNHLGASTPHGQCSCTGQATSCAPHLPRPLISRSLPRRSQAAIAHPQPRGSWCAAWQRQGIIYCETNLGIQSSDPNPYDRMNFPAFERLCGERLLGALQGNPRRDRPPPPVRPFASAVPCQPSHPMSCIDSIRHRCAKRLPLHPSELDGLKRTELAEVLGVQLRQRDTLAILRQRVLDCCPTAATPPPVAAAAVRRQTESPLQPVPRDTRHLVAYIRGSFRLCG